MNKRKNISKLIKRNLPEELSALTWKLATLAVNKNQSLYLVGGVVRDLLLDRPNLDLDFVIEGDAIGLAKELAQSLDGKLTMHPAFNTAKIRLGKWNIDIAMARTETYTRPGALPTVKPGTIETDLFRRDFTVNAIAVKLNPGNYGELVDQYGGLDDLKTKIIRVLHEKSFIDDSTRIWRAIRYEQRLNFSIDPETLRLLKRDITILKTISGDRVRHEFEWVLKEECPEKILHRAWTLKVLDQIHPSLRGDGWLRKKFQQARATGSKGQELIGLYLALFTYRLIEDELEKVIIYLRPSRQTTVILRDSNQLKSRIDELSQQGLRPSHIYSILDGYHYTTLMANYIGCSSTTARNAINLYLKKLRYIKSSLTGDDLRAMGVAPGPRMQESMILLHNARLNAEVNNREEEETIVKEWLKG